VAESESDGGEEGDAGPGARPRAAAPRKRPPAKRKEGGAGDAAKDGEGGGGRARKPAAPRKRPPPKRKEGEGDEGRVGEKRRRDEGDEGKDGEKKAPARKRVRKKPEEKPPPKREPPAPADPADLLPVPHDPALGERAWCAVCDGLQTEGEGGALVPCAGCGRAFHASCVFPPLNVGAARNWSCPTCIEGDGGHLGLGPVTELTYRQMERRSNELERSILRIFTERER